MGAAIWGAICAVSGVDFRRELRFVKLGATWEISALLVRRVSLLGEVQDHASTAIVDTLWGDFCSSSWNNNSGVDAEDASEATLREYPNDTSLLMDTRALEAD